MSSKHERAPRKEISREVEFIIDEDIISAETVNISETGIAFETNSPIPIMMRIRYEENAFTEHKAELVWARRKDNGSMTYGLEFCDGQAPKGYPSDDNQI
ncbi:MAG: PilZ domain-containing protein [Fibrobacterota bacterium]